MAWLSLYTFPFCFHWWQMEFGADLSPRLLKSKDPLLRSYIFLFLPAITLLKFYQPGFYLNIVSLIPGPWILTLPALDSNLVFFFALTGWLAEQRLGTCLIFI